MNDLQVIARYESILAVTGEMLEAAKSKDWDALLGFEKACSELVAELIAKDTARPLSIHLQQRKAEIIRKVLAHDAAIRNITEPWMAQLQNIFGSASRQRRLHQAYVSGGG